MVQSILQEELSSREVSLMIFLLQRLVLRSFLFLLRYFFFSFISAGLMVFASIILRFLSFLFIPGDFHWKQNDSNSSQVAKDSPKYSSRS